MTRQQSFTAEAWFATTDIRGAIDGHPFLRELKAGTLAPATFAGYLAQDAHYLIGYAKALSLCAAQASTPEHIAFWASNARDAIVVERSLHEVRVGGLPAVEPSPTCRAYLSFLLATAGEGAYPVLAAALLPCFWIYQDVGRRLKDSVELTGTPTRIGSRPTRILISPPPPSRSRTIVDGLAERGVQIDVRARMHVTRSRPQHATSGCSGTRPGAARPGRSSRRQTATPPAQPPRTRRWTPTARGDRACADPYRVASRCRTSRRSIPG